MDTRTVPTDVVVVAADHPSLARDVDAFLALLRDEPRFFGPTARTRPKPDRSLVASLGERGGFRLAAVECGRIVALARVDGAGELFLGVGTEHRGRGVGTLLARTIARRAAELNYPQLVLRTSGRTPPAARRIGERLRAVVVDLDDGRAELLLDLVEERTA